MYFYNKICQNDRWSSLTTLKHETARERNQEKNNNFLLLKMWSIPTSFCLFSFKTAFCELPGEALQNSVFSEGI